MAENYESQTTVYAFSDGIVTNLSLAAVSRCRSYAAYAGLLPSLTAYTDFGFATIQLIRERSALQQIAFFRVRETFLRLAAEVRSARADCRNASRQVRLYRDMMELARRQRDLVSGAYQSGRETVTRLDQAQRHFVICESNYVTTLAELGRACARLRAAMGSDTGNHGI